METLTGLFMARVDAFLERTGVGPTTLGRQAVGDPNLVRQLRHGRSPTLATADQLLAFMEAFEETPIGDRVSSRAGRLRDSTTRARGGRPMTRTMVQLTHQVRIANRLAAERRRRHSRAFEERIHSRHEKPRQRLHARDGEGTCATTSIRRI